MALQVMSTPIRLESSEERARGSNPAKQAASAPAWQQCYINGEWLESDNHSCLEVTNPGDGSVIGTVPNMGAAETRRAIEAANAA